MIEDVYPLSPLQQGMLFHHLLAPQSGVDIEQIVCSLSENLNIPALNQAWLKTIQHHAILRTAFRWIDLDQPQQEVHDQVGQDFISPTAPQDVILSDFLRADRLRGLDLSRPPLMRLQLVRVNSKTKLVWTFHHILLDGRSFPLILKEVFDHYNSIIQASPIELAAPRPYKDFIHWLQTQSPEKSKNFWQENLKGFTAPTPLVVERDVISPTGYDTRTDTLSIDNTN